MSFIEVFSTFAVIFKLRLIIFPIFISVPVCGLSNLQIHIPATIQRGQSPIFECTFTLESEALYAIKWYRGNYEIFRYVPTELPSIKTFPLEGYNVSVRPIFLLLEIL